MTDTNTNTDTSILRNQPLTCVHTYQEDRCTENKYDLILIVYQLSVQHSYNTQKMPQAEL